MQFLSNFIRCVHIFFFFAFYVFGKPEIPEPLELAMQFYFYVIYNACINHSLYNHKEGLPPGGRPSLCSRLKSRRS